MKVYKISDCCLLRVEGENCFRLFSVCAKKKVTLYDIEPIFLEDKRQCNYKAYIRRRDLSVVCEAALKTNSEVIVEKEYGIFAFLRKYISRKMFFISISVGICFLYCMTLFIWQIRISGCKSNKESDILGVINSCGVGYGIKKSKCDCEKIEEAIRNKYNDVLWVSASLNGTGLFVNIKENTYLNDKLALSEGTSDLTCDRDGIVKEIITRAGVPRVKEGDEVKNGDILISGRKEYLNDSKEVYMYEDTYADGDVIIESNDNFTWNVDRTVQVRKYDGRDKKSIRLFLFKKRIINLKCKVKGKKYEKRHQKNVVVVGNSFYLPVNVELDLYKAYNTKKIVLTDESLKNYAGILCKMFYIKENGKGVDIIEKDAKIRFMDNSCSIDVVTKSQQKSGIHTEIAPYETELPKEETVN